MIDAIDISGETVDLSKYQLKTDDALSTTDKTIIGSINELNTNKADKNDIPSLSGYATETYVDNKDIILTSPNGSKFKLVVSDDGILSTQPLE